MNKIIHLPIKRPGLRHRIVAGFLSFALPGLGQIYKGDKEAGFGILVVFSFSCVLVITLPLAPLIWIAGIGHAITATTAQRIVKVPEINRGSAVCKCGARPGKWILVDHDSAECPKCGAVQSLVRAA